MTEETYSRKFEETAAQPKHRGAYYKEDALEKGMALVQAKFKDIKLCWLVDVREDRVYSARFFAYGGKVSLGIGETLCSMAEGLTVQEACSLLGDDMERALRDDAETPAVPQAKRAAFDVAGELLKIVENEYPAAKATAQAAAAIKDNGPSNQPPSFAELSLVEQAWLGLSKEEQIDQIDIVLDEKIRPALINDGGNVDIVDVVEGRKVLIEYQGACGSCGSSIGGTLSFIEQTLRNHVFKDLVVTPNTPFQFPAF